MCRKAGCLGVGTAGEIKESMLVCLCMFMRLWRVCKNMYVGAWCVGLRRSKKQKREKKRNVERKW